MVYMDHGGNTSIIPQSHTGGQMSNQLPQELTVKPGLEKSQELTFGVKQSR